MRQRASAAGGRRCVDDGLVEALRSLNRVELPRPASQVEPAPYPLDGAAVGRTWGCADPSFEAVIPDPPVHHHDAERSDSLLRDVIGVQFRSVRFRLAAYIRGLAGHHRIKMSNEAVDSAIAQGFEQPLYELCARPFLAAFLELKLDGAIAQGAKFSYGLETFPDEIARKVARDFPRLRWRAKDLAVVLARSMHHLLRRFDTDHDALSDKLGTAGRVYAVDEIEFLGDPHGRGGRVARLRLLTSCGRSHELVYKPRSLDVDDAFYRLADVLAEKDGQSLSRPWFLCREGYGWMQFVSPRDCSDLDGVRSFYFRLGWLAALIYALSGRDIHAGNVVAQGECPVLVDLECLLTPAIALGASSDDGRPMVTATAIIPMVRFAVGGFHGMDVSAFSGGYGGSHYYSDWRIGNLESVAPHVRRVRAKTAIVSNRPRLTGKSANPFEFCDEFINGFERGYRCLLRERRWLVSVDGPLRAFAGTETRIVIRNTGEYAKAISESSAPALLVSKDAEIEHYRQCLGQRVPGAVDEEIRQLRRGRIPRFGIRSDSSSDGGVLDGMNVLGNESGLQQVRGFLADHLSDADLSQQVKLIRHCIGTMALNRVGRIGGRRRMRLAADPEHVLQSVLASLDGRRRSASKPDWLSYEVSRAGALVVSRAHWGAYSGNAGILGACFQLEAAGYRSDDSALCRSVAHLASHPEVVHTSPVHGINGLASFVLLDALVTRTGRRGLAEIRQTSLRAIRDQSIAGRGGMAGVAGSILALAAAQQVDAGSDIRSILLALLQESSKSGAFVQLEEAVKLDQEPMVSWTVPWVTLLATARAARVAGHDEVSARCADIFARPMLQASAPQARLLRMLLWLEAGSEGAYGLLKAEFELLCSQLGSASLASQYGSGALVGVWARMLERGLVDSGAGSEFASEYVKRVALVLDGESVANPPLCMSCDIARGLAGVALRVAQVCVRKSFPAAVVF